MWAIARVKLVLHEFNEIRIPFLKKAYEVVEVCTLLALLPPCEVRFN